MKVFKGLESAKEIPSGGVVFAAGVFDGVHLGHAAVFAAAREVPTDGEVACGALTFEPNPAQVLRPDRCPPRICSRREKLVLLESHGLEFVLELPFTREFASLPPEQFLENLTAACEGRLRALCAGTSWSFGRAREGTMESVKKFGERHGFEGIGIEPLEIGGRVVSSTRVRSAVLEGDLEDAERCLGRPFAMTGIVVEGARLGRTLGFPTANLLPEADLLPPDGVYAATVERDGVELPAVVNLGVRPTVDGCGERKLEAHLLGFSNSIYGERLHVTCRHRLRGEKKFSSLEALKCQISQDVEAASAWLDQHLLANPTVL